MSYDLKNIEAPRATGGMLRALVAALENPLTGGVVADKLLAQAGLERLRAAPSDWAPDARPPVFDHGQPLASAGDPGPDLSALAASLTPPPAGEFVPETAADLVAAYRESAVGPIDIAERAIAWMRQSDELDPPMRTMIAHSRDDLMEQARAAAERYRSGQPLGPLDGVPVAVKDEVDQRGYPTTVGTRFLGQQPAADDATVVARLRAAGALLIGKTNMHEIGLGVTGLNPHHGAARNPYDPGRATGGSSSGPAAAVAMGLCPLAVGADGGGSIRIPAALCGQLGLKATFGRMSERGAAPLCWSVAHLGPIAASVRDLALGYAAMAGPDAADPGSLLQPAPMFDDLSKRDLGGLRIGVFRPWFDDAEPAVVARCREAVGALTEAGAELCEVTIDDLDLARVAHTVTIVAEMTAAHLGHYRSHRADYGLDTRANLALGRRLHAYDYVHAQRHRAAIYRRFMAVLAEVDVLVTPATARTAPPLRDDALRTGESDLAVLGEIMRFAPPANLTGLPAISVPAGYDEQGLPVGLQLMGRPWQEHLLVRLAAVVEQATARRQPTVHRRYLDS